MGGTVAIREHDRLFDLYGADGFLVGKASPGKKVMPADALYVPGRTCRIVSTDMAGNPRTGQATGFSTRCLTGVQSAGIRSTRSTGAGPTTVLTAGRVSSRRSRDNRLGAPGSGAEAAGS